MKITLAEIASTFYILHANFSQNMENSDSMHGTILQDYNVASIISNKTENISFLHRRDH